MPTTPKTRLKGRPAAQGALTEVHPLRTLPAPLRSMPSPWQPAATPAVRTRQDPVPGWRREPRRVTPAAPVVLDAVPEGSAMTRSAMARRLRHQTRMDTIAEARAVAWLIFAVLCCLALVVVGTLVVGAMLGGWPVPVASP